MNIPSDVVRRGLVGGFRCPISGKEFVSDDGRHDTKERLYREQQEHTAALMLDMDGGQYSGRDVASYRAQYADYAAKQAATP